MTSLTRWTWVRVSSRSWWWIGKPGTLQFVGSQRVRLNWTELNYIYIDYFFFPPHLKLFILYWGRANKQYCDSFRWIAMGLNPTYTCIHSPPNPLAPRLPHSTEQSPLSYTIGPSRLSILNRAMCAWPSPIPQLSLSSSNHKFIFCLWVSFCYVNTFICIISFIDSAYKGCPMIFLLLCLTSLSMTISRSIHVAANGIISFF